MKMNRNAKITLTAMCLALLPLVFLASPKSDAEDPVKPPAAGDKSGGLMGAPERSGGFMGMRDKNLTEEQEKELLELFKNRKSEFYDNLIKLKDSNPPAYKQMIRRFWGRYQEIKTMPKDLQEVALLEQDLKIAIWKTSSEIRTAKSGNDSQKVQELTDKLKGMIGQQFDAEMKMNEYRLNQFEERLKKLREELKQRVEQKSQVVEERLTGYLQDTPATMPGPGKHGGMQRPGEHEKPVPEFKEKKGSDE